MPALYQPGERVVTPAGIGTVVEIAGAPGAEVITVRLVGRNIPSALREHPIASLRPEALRDVEAIDRYLFPSVTPEDVEAFLESDSTPVTQPDRLGRAIGAKITPCDCACGREGGCQRLSTSTMHFENSGACRCETKGCTCS